MKTYTFNLKVELPSVVEGQLKTISRKIVIEGNHYTDQIAEAEAKSVFRKRNPDFQHFSDEKIEVEGFSCVENRTLNIEKPRNSN